MSQSVNQPQEPALPDLLLERYVLGELPPDQFAQVRNAIERDVTIRERLQALLTSTEPEPWIAPVVRARLERGAPAGWSVPQAIKWLVPAAALLALTIAFVRPLAEPGADSIPVNDGSTERLKGPDATLAIYRQTASGSEALDRGSSVRAGDVIRVGYRLAQSGFGVIVSIDGRGVVTRHLPSEGSRAAALPGGNLVLLDQAYELDDAPRWERFYIVTSRTSFDVEAVVRAAQATAAVDRADTPLKLPSELGQFEFVLQKDVPP